METQTLPLHMYLNIGKLDNRIGRLANRQQSTMSSSPKFPGEKAMNVHIYALESTMNGNFQHKFPK